MWSFNTQPPEGDCVLLRGSAPEQIVSTHSRPKATDLRNFKYFHSIQFQHTAARRRLLFAQPISFSSIVSTHSRSKATVFQSIKAFSVPNIVSTHSRPKATVLFIIISSKFKYVSTHSRPKATGFAWRRVFGSRGFNTQPPEGDWVAAIAPSDSAQVSTHSRPKATAV